jgi:hypothetical protein
MCKRGISRAGFAIGLLLGWDSGFGPLLVFSSVSFCIFCFLLYRLNLVLISGLYFVQILEGFE